MLFRSGVVQKKRHAAFLGSNLVASCPDRIEVGKVELLHSSTSRWSTHLSERARASLRVAAAQDDEAAGIEQHLHQRLQMRLGCRTLNKKDFSIFPFKFTSMGTIAEKHGVEYAKALVGLKRAQGVVGEPAAR